MPVRLDGITFNVKVKHRKEEITVTVLRAGRLAQTTRHTGFGKADLCRFGCTDPSVKHFLLL
jgi:hypothetical protein